MLSEGRRLNDVAECGPCAGREKVRRDAGAESGCGTCTGTRNLGRDTKAESARRSRAGMRTLCRRGICAGNAESGACAKTGRSCGEDSGTDGPESAFPGAVRGFLPEFGGKAIRRKNGLCIRVQAFFRQSKHEGRRPFGRLAPGEGSALRRETAEGSSKAFFALGSGGELGRSAFVQPSLVQR